MGPHSVSATFPGAVLDWGDRTLSPPSHPSQTFLFLLVPLPSKLK